LPEHSCRYRAGSPFTAGLSRRAPGPRLRGRQPIRPVSGSRSAASTPLTVLGDRMFAAVPVYISAAASESEGNSPVFYIILAVGIGLVTFFSNRIAQRKSRKSLTAATDGLVDGYTAIIAPAPPFPDAIRRMRDLLAETTPEPRITRYTRGVVLADSTGLTISDEKNGTFLTIPAADIVSIEARTATIKPRGVIIPRRFPAALVKVRRSGAEAEIALVPIVGTYNKVTLVEAATFAAELSSHVGLAKVATSA